MDYTEPLGQLIYCLEQGYPRPVTVALLRLDSDLFYVELLDQINQAWHVWKRFPNDTWKRLDFKTVIETLTTLTVFRCEDCGAWHDSDESALAVNETLLCDGCAEAYALCVGCDRYALYYNDVEGSPYCEDCTGEYCFYCESCEEWSHNKHDHTCDCVAPHQRFSFPANGAGTVSNDERLEVTLPAGVIDQVGMRAIQQLIYDSVKGSDTLSQHIGWGAIYNVLEAVGDQWQTKQGNFTRRVSRQVYKTCKAKLPDGILSEVGNLARQHSSETSEWTVEFTRDLNLGPDEFCHEDSCWWQSYYLSRCALKNWGGLGLRTWEQSYGGYVPTGRAWVQPLTENLEPTHDAIGAHAYIVYNAYGAIDGYRAARIVAHLTSMTYRKVTFSSGPQYVNDDKGFLVAPEDTCINTDRIHLRGDPHDHFDADFIPDPNKEIA